MDTVDHDDLAAEAAGEARQEYPRHAGEMSRKELRERFARLLREYASSVRRARCRVRDDSPLACLSELAQLERMMIDESRAVRP